MAALTCLSGGREMVLEAPRGVDAKEGTGKGSPPRPFLLRGMTILLSKK